MTQAQDPDNKGSGAIPHNTSTIIADRKGPVRRVFIIRRDGRVAEGAPLLREYTLKPYRGFESLSLRHVHTDGLKGRGYEHHVSGFEASIFR